MTDEQRKVVRLTTERDALYDATERLVRFLDKHGGYMSPEHQRALRNAKALLVEVQRSPMGVTTP